MIEFVNVEARRAFVCVFIFSSCAPSLSIATGFQVASLWVRPQRDLLTNELRRCDFTTAAKEVFKKHLLFSFTVEGLFKRAGEVICVTKKIDRCCLVYNVFVACRYSFKSDYSRWALSDTSQVFILFHAL